MSNRVLIIAEAGVNHNGDMGFAKRLIDSAADSGADIVKFQTFSADRQVTRGAIKAQYQLLNTSPEESQFEMLRRLELSGEMHAELVAHCRLRNIEFLSTAFDIESVDLLMALGLRRFKIPSGEITNLPYLRHIAKTEGDVILSTGMATLGEVENAIGELERGGIAREKITVLHCTTEYPAPVEDVNLRAMQSMKAAFGLAVGYSDHTSGSEISVAAVALGARIIEKHLTLSRSLPGPDHMSSLEPDAFREMVSAIRNVEAALGDGIKRPVASELSNRLVARKSIVARVSIRRGEVVTDEMLAAKRPGTGLSPMLWDRVVGSVARRDFLPDEPIEL